MAKNIMKEIGDVMEKVFYKKKDDKNTPKLEQKTVIEDPKKEVNNVVDPDDPEGRLSAWQKKTDVDYKMRKQQREAGI